MSADRTYARVSFPPADFCALGPVRVFGPDGELIRTIPVAALRARDAANEKAVEAAAKAELADHPTVPRRSSRGRAFVPKRHRKAAQA